MEQPTEHHPEHPEDGSAHPILGFLGDVAAGLDGLESVDPTYLSPAQLRSAVVEMTRQGHRYEALRLRLIAAADAAHVGEVDGSASTGAWLAHHTRTDHDQAHRQVRLARHLDRDRPATQAALAAGDISPAQAQVVVTAVDRLPRDLDAQTRAAGEDALLREARVHPPKSLRRLGRRLLEVIAPEVAEDQLRRQVEADEAAAWAKTRLSMHENPDGTTHGWFTLPTLHARMLAAALEAITAPRKQTRATAGDPATPGTTPGTTTGADADTESQDAPTTGWSRVDAATRRGQALAQLLEHLPVDRLGDHGSTTATVVVTMTFDDLTNRLVDSGALGIAGLDDGTPISAGHARKLACEARPDPDGPRWTLRDRRPWPHPETLHPPTEDQPQPARQTVPSRRLHHPRRLVRGPPPHPLVQRREDRPRRRHPAVRPPPPTDPLPRLPAPTPTGQQHRALPTMPPGEEVRERCARSYWWNQSAARCHSAWVA